MKKNKIIRLLPCLPLLALAQGSPAQESTPQRTPHSSMWLKAWAKAGAQVPFNYGGKGTEYNLLWGLDTAWDSEDNVKRGTAFIGEDCIGIGRISFQPSDLVDENGELSSAQKDALDSRIAHIKLSGTTDVTLNCDHEALVSANYYGKPEQWYKVIKASVKYAQGKGMNVVSIAPFNEPDYTPWGEGSQADFKAIAKLISEDEDLKGIRISAGNTLNCDQALSWYNYMKPYVTEGNTHQLAGSFDSYASFFTTVRNDGNYATADELHNVAEAMVGVEYGLQAGIWWGFDGVSRGDFCKANTAGGARLGYAENRDAWTAASVYRLPAGNVEAFLGSSERQANTSTFEFVSLDRDVYYDGYGPVRAYRQNIPGGTSYQTGQTNAERTIRIEQGEDVQPFKLEGGTYVIMNKKTRQVMTIYNGSTENGQRVVQNSYSGTASKPYQQWIVQPVSERVGGDFGYSYIKSARDTTVMLDLLNWSLQTGGTAIAYKGSGGNNEQWYFEYAGDGDFYIRSRHSALCLEIGNGSTTSNANVRQASFTGEAQQRWRFIPTDAQRELKAPSTPSGLEATPQAASVRLDWAANNEGDLDGYMVLRGETVADTTQWSVIGRKVQGTAFVDNSCSQGKAYLYKIKAIDRASNMSEATVPVTSQTSGEKAIVAHYEFDDSLIDMTDNQFDAAMPSEPAYNTTYAKTGQALHLTGSTYALLPAQVSNMREMTISLWAYWQSSTSWQRIFDFGNGTEQYMFLTPSNGSEMRLVFKNGGDEQILSASKLPIRKLTHLAITMDADSVKLYLNGKLAASTASISIRPSDFAPVMNYIGRSQYAADPYFRGYMDDFRVYNYALDANEIAKVYENTTDGIAAPSSGKGTADVISTEFFTLDGVRSSEQKRGISIVRERLGNGKTVVKKTAK